MSLAVPEPHLRPDQMVARAVALRQHLRDDQAKTEARSRYSEETHTLFTEAGFYRMLQPRMFGGYEFEPQTFYRTIIEIARGCPSTGWMLCLGSGHALQVARFGQLRVRAFERNPTWCCFSCWREISDGAN